MNRTALVASLLVGWLPAVAAAQAPVAPPAAKAQTDPIDELVAVMRAAEKKLKSIAIEMTTAGQLPSGLTVSVRGALHVLRGEQAATHTRFEYETGDGMRGRSESSQTSAGIVLYEEDPAFGEVFVQLDPKVVADLEWAGGVLRRDDLPGMPARDGGSGAVDRRAAAPLGSAVVAASKRQFTLAVDARRERAGEPGTWLTGARRPGLDVQDPDLPIADRVELFVRTKDHALLEMRQFVGDVVVQQLVVDKIEVDGEMPPRLFRVDGGSLRVKPVQQYQPLWEQIEQACSEAEAKSEKSEVRPSKR